jgi:cytochrome c oxidase subunit III
VVHETHAPAHVHHGDAPHTDGHHGLVQHQFDTLEQQRESYTLGMWLFLATEVMMFGGLFFAYSLYRGMYPGGFEAGSHHLNISLGTINTFVLLFSSYTMARAVHAAGSGNRRGLVFFMSITWLLGAAFLGIKAIEWGTDWNEGLVPGLKWTYYDHHPDEVQALVGNGVGPHQVLMYFTIYFSMTGLHAIHMIIGLLLVGYFTWLGNRGVFTNGNDQPVEILGLYWHLVDIVWIFLFPLLYLIAGFHPFGAGGPPGGGH